MMKSPLVFALVSVAVFAARAEDVKELTDRMVRTLEKADSAIACVNSGGTVRASGDINMVYMALKREWTSIRMENLVTTPATDRDSASVCVIFRRDK